MCRIESGLAIEMIEIEFNEPFRSVCDCCDDETTSLTRFVKKHGDAYAVYFGYFVEAHPEQGMTGIISIGMWGDGTSPNDRNAFAFVMWGNFEGYSIQLINAEETPWGNAEIIGSKLTWMEAEDHPWIDEFYQMADEIFDKDPEVRSFFGRGST
jgi:hypothetical protein